MKYGLQAAQLYYAIATSVNSLTINYGSKITGTRLSNSSALMTVPRYVSLRLLPEIASTDLAAPRFIVSLENRDFLLWK